MIVAILAPQAQMMAKSIANERRAMTLQCVAIGSMIIMAGAAAAHLMKELFGRTERRGRSKRSGRAAIPGTPVKEQPAAGRSCVISCRPEVGNQVVMMVPDYGPQTARLATAIAIPA